MAVHSEHVTPLGVDSCDPRNHVSHKRAQWCQLANTIAYVNTRRQDDVTAP